MEVVKNGKITEQNPLHFLMNMMSLVVYSFINCPL